MTHVFVSKAASAIAAGTQLLLDGDEGHHAVKVRRINVGELVEVIDGNGTRVFGVVESVGKQSCIINVKSVTIDPLPTKSLTVIQALTKKDRSDQVIELLTEVGVDAVIPWRAHRSITTDVPAKWARIIAESCKQSRQARFPAVAEVVDSADAVALARDHVAAGAQLLVCHESATSPISTSLDVRADAYVIVIGPEGGLTDDELRAFENVGAQTVCLGPSVLRAATAGAVAASIVSAITHRWADQESAR